MNNLDLDIGNYSIKDMEKFFQLSPNYNASAVEYSETRIREMLISTSGIIDKKMKRELIDFLTTAKQWLIFVKCKPIANPSALPTNPKLDNSEFPQQSSFPSYTEHHRQHDLIDQQKTPFIHTMPSEFQSGTMNPLHTRILTKCLTVDTRFRENYYTTMSSDINIQLPQRISKVVSMQLASMEIPMTFYGITEHYGNNYVNMEVTYLDTSLNQIITKTRTTTIPDGNYGGQDLVCVLNNLHAPMKSNATLANPRDVWSYIYFALDISEAGSGSGKVWIKSNMVDASNQRIKIQNVKLDCTRNAAGIVDNGDLSSKLSWLMGFTQRIYTGNTTYIAEAIIEPNPIRYIYLVVDDFNNSVNSHFLSAYASGVNNPNILARISIKGGYFCLIMDNDLNITTEPRRYFGPVDIQKLRVQLIDDRGRILDMNSTNYSFCLNFKVLYDL